MPVENIARQVEGKTQSASQFVFSQQGKKQWENLFAVLEEKLRQSEPCIIPIVRCWAKSEEELRNWIQRFDGLRQSIAGIIGVILVINKEGEEELKGDTAQIVEKIDDSRLLIVPVEIKNYTWTAGLNGPMAILSQFAKEKNLPSNQIVLFPMSFDVVIPSGSAQIIEKKIQQGEYHIATIRDQKGYYQNNVEARQEIIETIIQKFATPGNDVEIESLLSAMRNTAILLPLSEVEDMKGYSNACNPTGGMEDHDLYTRLFFKTLYLWQTGKTDDSKVRMLLQTVHDLVPYIDEAWEQKTQEQQKIKIEREINSVKAIQERVKVLKQRRKQDDFQVEEYNTPEEYRDFTF